ncbi:hypothetical protein Hanom_Chr06g00499071 [Helianthus anomalus]
MVVRDRDCLVEKSLRALHLHQHLVENIACNTFLCNVEITMCSEMSRISTTIGGRWQFALLPIYRLKRIFLLILSSSYIWL